MPSLSSLFRQVLRSPAARRTGRQLTRSAVRAVQQRSGSGTRTPVADRRSDAGGVSTTDAHRVLADRSAEVPVRFSYQPVADDHPDPGEIVWAWVHYEEDPHQGKDRPVLVLAEEDASVGGSDGAGTVLVCLMLTSRDRGAGEHTDEHGSTYVDVGTGEWDSRRRPSEVRVDRVLRIPLESVRREGGRLDRQRYATVADATRRVHGWDR